MQDLPGLPTLHSRVESWECDFNDHWNARFYFRSFQLASEVIAAGGMAFPSRKGSRHVRFHAELRMTDPVEVRSGLLPHGDYAGNLAHLIYSDDRLAATSLELDGPVSDLPDLPPAIAKMVLPRGVEGGAVAPVALSGGFGKLAQLGPVRPAETDGDGRLLEEEVIRRVGIMNNLCMTDLGLTREYSAQNGLSRMAVEARITRHRDPKVGDCLRGTSRLTGIAEKSVGLRHDIFDANGHCLVSYDQRLILVNLATRRAVPVPEILRRHMPVSG